MWDSVYTSILNYFRTSLFIRLCRFLGISSKRNPSWIKVLKGSTYSLCMHSLYDHPHFTFSPLFFCCCCCSSLNGSITCLNTLSFLNGYSRANPIKILQIHPVIPSARKAHLLKLNFYSFLYFLNFLFVKISYLSIWIESIFIFIFLM